MRITSSWEERFGDLMVISLTNQKSAKVGGNETKDSIFVALYLTAKYCRLVPALSLYSS